MTLITDEQASAALGVAELDADLWYDLAERLTCTEAEAIAQFLYAFHGEGAATSFLASHSAGDDAGDEHEPVWTEDEDEQSYILTGYRRRDAS